MNLEFSLADRSNRNRPTGSGTGGNLQNYDEILLVVHAHGARPELAINSGRLVGLREERRLVVMQYNTAEYEDSCGLYLSSITKENE
jgi:hypothetical protein